MGDFELTVHTCTTEYRVNRLSSGEIKLIHYVSNDSVQFHVHSKSRGQERETHQHTRVYLKEMSLSWIDFKIERKRKIESQPPVLLCWNIGTRYEIVRFKVYTVKRAGSAGQALTLIYETTGYTSVSLNTLTFINSTFHTEITG